MKPDGNAPKWFRNRDEECEFYLMLNEAKDLAAKIYELTDTILKSDVYDQSLLVSQRDAMVNYYNCLQARIRRVLDTQTPT